ncbi:PolC-type DNA polymerase III [Clostridium sediminicola]|uniref:PolC-type DNA polymerase III n=1 Tax=Clostridium sediminicola TaxID=3114879 RepID=UPI0031F26E29
MNQSLVCKLKEEFNSNENLTSDNLKIQKVQFLSKSGKVRLFLKSKNDIDTNKETLIKKIISNNLNGFCNIDLIISKDISKINVKDIINKYWIDIISKVAQSIPLCKECLYNAEKKLENNILTLFTGEEFLYTFLNQKKIEKHIENTIMEMFAMKVKIIFKYKEGAEDNSEEFFRKRETEEINIIKNIIKNRGNSDKKATDNKKSASSKGNSKGDNKFYKGKDAKKSDNPNVIFGRDFSGDSVEINTINQTSGVVSICGDIIKLEIIETKAGRKIFVFNVTDYSSSITIKCFPRPKDTERLVEELRKGMTIRLRGEATFDTYSREVVIMGRDIIKTTKIEKMDICEEKRVELHLHTQMSSMDAITPTSKLVERAAKWGHKAIGITDHGVVQAFPEAMDAGEKHNIKILYGVEAYLVDDGEPIAIKCDKKTINDVFVVFDIETTGFSSKYDKIIEIGAVKIKNGSIIDRFSEFINPETNIPMEIVKLTGITNETVKNANTIDNVLPGFIDFVQDSILVAHNANFDVSFIRKNCNDLDIEFDMPVLDTIPLSKFLYPELKRFKLNTICKYLGISLENHHRAVDDAFATSEILLEGIKRLKEMEIETIEELNNKYLQTLDIKKMNTYHLIIFAKNQKGIKSLYKLVSQSNLEYFFRRPRMPKSLISKYKEDLIIGSACEAGQIFTAVLQGKTDEELQEMIKFYDFLEIQPTGNNEFMIRKGIVKSNEQIQELNKTICDLGEKNNLPVVATGDVHFIDAENAIFREILMSGKGFSDAKNQPPLYFRTTNEMLKEFEYLGKDKAKEVVITNTNKIANLIEDVLPIPKETFPPKIEGADDDIRNMTMNKAKSIYGDPLPEIVQKRLDKELNSIISNGYAVLYLIAHKLVAKSLSDGYLVGSRGSVGSSLVATMTDITEVNGLPAHYVCPECKYSEFITDGSVSSGVDLPDKECPKCGTIFKKEGFDIPFETFLGFKGDKEPDIDLNFSGDNQGDIHKYTEVLFGKGHTFKAGTIGTIAQKTAYGYVRKYLDENDIKVPSAEIDRLTDGCTGVKRTSGQHPGGIMVVPSDNEIYNFCPVQHPADDPNSDIITTHFDYHSISGRLLKLDILGHDDPTVLRMLKDITGIDPTTVPIADEKVLSLFTSTEGLGVTEEELGCPVGTYGVPEFGTKFVRQMLLDTKPKTFSDLARISGLSHGTDVWLNNAQYFIKEGYTTLKDCISTRDDIMVYLIYKDVPPHDAFTIMEKVRKGKGLTAEQEVLMREHAVPDWYIESCKRIKYMFPKGHAVAYVMMAMRIAYYKVYYPEAYYSAYFTVRGIDDFDADLICKGIDSVKLKIKEIEDMGNAVSQKEKGLLTILELSHEMYIRGINFLKVDLYKSDASKFLIMEDGILPPLCALAGVGVNAAKSIAEARKAGEFISKEDLRLRSKVTKSVIETLSIHGCLKGMPETNQLCLF